MEKQHYIDRNGSIYPRSIDEVAHSIDVLKPNTFLPILQEMDYPFLENEWLRYVKRELLYKGNSMELFNRRVFGKYISCMNLRGYKNMTFKDSVYNFKVLKYKPVLKWDIEFEYEAGA